MSPLSSAIIFFFFIQHGIWCLVPFFLLLVCVTFDKTSPSEKKPACAACKSQRRRCPPDCPLAPYFPAEERPEIFSNAHRLFGVAKMIKILKQIKDEDLHEDAMKSIKFESNMWRTFPELGCRAVVMKLARDIQLVQLELNFVRLLIDRFSAGFSTSYESGSDPSLYPDQNSCPASSSRTTIPQGLPPFHVKGKGVWIQEQYEDVSIPQESLPFQQGYVDLDQNDVKGKGVSIQEQYKNVWIPQGSLPFQQGDVYLDQNDVKGKGVWIQEQYEDVRIPQGSLPFQQGYVDLDQNDVRGKGVSIQEQYEDAEAQYDAMNEAVLAKPEYDGSKKPVVDQGEGKGFF